MPKMNELARTKWELIDIGMPMGEVRQLPFSQYEKKIEALRVIKAWLRAEGKTLDKLAETIDSAGQRGMTVAAVRKSMGKSYEHAWVALAVLANRKRVRNNFGNWVAIK